MKEKPLLAWVAANALGLGLGFVAYLQAGWLFDYGLEFDKHWQTDIAPLPNNFILGFATVPMMLVVAGVIFGSAQAMVLRSNHLPTPRWILSTVVGFVFLAVLIVPLDAVGIMGNIPGPVEPMIFTIGGCILAGIFQYVFLRRREIHASKWLGLWVVGLFVSVIPTALMFFVLQGLADLSLSWPIEVFLNGFMCAGVAAWLSGNALFIAICETDKTGPVVAGGG